MNADIFQEIAAELDRARSLGFPPFNSEHEGFAVLLEEVDELKAEVWRNNKSLDYVHMRKEAIEVAAMAVKFIERLDAREEVN